MHTADLTALHGRVVLVCSAQDHRNPPTGRRGTLLVRDGRLGGRAVVQVELEFPQMFTTRAHTRVVTLDDAQVAELLRSEHEGAYTVTLRDALDLEAPRD